MLTHANNRKLAHQHLAVSLAYGSDREMSGRVVLKLWLAANDPEQASEVLANRMTFRQLIGRQADVHLAETVPGTQGA